MQISEHRILTTHVGSLPRTKAVTDIVFAAERGDSSEGAETIIRDALDDVVRRQLAVGIDVVSDGEMSKISYATYIKDRITGFDKERIRLHVCWGNYEGPHHHDAPMTEVLPIALGANVGALLFESSNPRHAHEWQVFEQIELPQDLVLVPGVVDSTTNFIEHPELVAERIGRFADIVGRERVIAGTDCGFSTFAGFGAVDPDIVYAKLKSLAEGAAIASERLWGRTAQPGIH